MHHRLSLCFIAFLTIVAPLAMSGQDTSATWRFSAAPFTGFIISHHPEMRYMPRERLWALELSASQSTDGSKDWHHYFNFPQWGFTLDLFDFGSPFIGRGAAGKIFFDLPLDRQKRFGLKLSIGAGYVGKPFDLDDNIHNSAISSHLNAALGAEGYVRIGLGDHFTLKPGIGLHHFSNGAFKMPNSGINMPGISVALAYQPGEHTDPTRRSPDFGGVRSDFFVGASGGAKEIKPLGGPKYAVVNLIGLWTIRVSAKSSFGAEGGLNYNESLRYRLADIDQPPGDKAYNYRPYLAGVYQLHFDPLLIRFGVGSYINPKFDQDGNVFLRYHLVYEWRDWQIFGGLKSHYARADNIEVGLLYRLHQAQSKN